jgi:ribonuclease HIII
MVDVMGNSTQVFQLTPADAQALRDRLNRGDYEFRRLQHALFQARGEGVVVSMYRSGKLVVQGAGAEAWHTRYLGGQAALEPRTSRDAKMPEVADSYGSDEAGKGDTFGALVVCAVAVPEAAVEELMASRVADSKSLDDRLVHILAPWLRERLPFALRVLPPPEYNRRWMEAGSNVNKLLTILHVDCLRELHGQCGFRTAVVDRFSPSAPVSVRMRSLQPEVKVHEVPRAEKHAAVAAASVIARAAFLDDMRRLSERWALDLPLGSGTPVLPAMRRFVALHSADEMREVAKVHFKNVQKFLTGN